MVDNETSIEKPPFYIRRFFLILVLLGILGGFLALTVPLWKSWAETPKTNCLEFIIGWIGSLLSSLIPNHDDEKYPQGKVITDLRLHILYITGGIIAILTLLQTNWKNLVDRRKVEDDIQKNKNDHIRQVHAERRTRYAKAIEQLADDKAVIRLGGIYTLVSLVDEWIADDSKEKDGVNPQHEGQTIINNLCAYIRAPFSLANSHYILDKDDPTEKEIDEYGREDFVKHKIEFYEEKDIRQTILFEIKSRLNSGFTEHEDGTKTPLKGPWSVFTYDFSKSFIFYPFNLSGSYFASSANFKGAIFIHTFKLSESVFFGECDFSGIRFTFKDYTPYSHSPDFEGTIFENTSKFSGSVFEGTASFKGIRANTRIDFIGCKFKLGSIFSGSKLKDSYFSTTRFSENYETYPYSGADFTRVNFRGKTNFRGANFYFIADFTNAVFEGDLEFTNTTFGSYATFIKTVFKGNIHLAEMKFSENCKVDFSDSLFNISIYYSWLSCSPSTFILKNLGIFSYTIKNDKNSESHIRCLPVGARIFDPLSWSDEEKEYRIISEPTSTIDRSFNTLRKIENSDKLIFI